MMNFIREKLPDSYRIVAKNAFLVFALRALQRILGLAALYFVVRAIDQDMFGQYQFIISIVAFLSVFALPETNNAIMQSIARGHLGTYRHLQPYSFAGSVLGACFLFGIAGWYWEQDAHDLAAGFAIAALLFPFMHGLTQWRALKTGMEDFSSLVKWEGSVAILMQITVIAGVLILPGTFLVPLLFVMAFPAVQNLFLTWQTYRQVTRDDPVEEGSLPYVLRTTLYAVPAMLSLHIEKFLLFFFLSPAALALFVVAEKIPELVKNLIQDVAAVLAPRLARHKHYTARLDRIFKYFALAAALSIVLVAFTILPWFFTLLFGETYEKALPYTIALMCSVAIGSITLLRVRFIRSQMDTDSMRDIYFVMAFVRIVAAIIFVPLWGLAGAVMSVSLTRLVMVITVHLVIRKRYPITSER